jgi:hypothetical protein
MKRKAQAQLQKTTTKAAPAKPQQTKATRLLTKAQSPTTKRQVKPQTRGAQKREEEEVEEDDFDEEEASSGEDIGDIDEYMKGEDSDKDESFVEFDDGEVSVNLPKKKKRFVYLSFYLFIYSFYHSF